MKSVLFALAFVLVPFFAHAEDTFPTYYAPSTSQAASCREGQTEMLIVANANGDSSERVLVTCHNGAFAEAKVVKHASCREGQTEMLIVYNASNDSQDRVLVTCHNGRFQ